jgi:hypothetical protein
LENVEQLIWYEATTVPEHVGAHLARQLKWLPYFLSITRITAQILCQMTYLHAGSRFVLAGYMLECVVLSTQCCINVMQRYWGKCNESFMVEQNYCANTCGRSPCPPLRDEDLIYVPSVRRMDLCTDLAPVNTTCDIQVGHCYFTVAFLGNG